MAPCVLDRGGDVARQAIHVASLALDADPGALAFDSKGDAIEEDEAVEFRALVVQVRVGSRPWKKPAQIPDGQAI